MDSNPATAALSASHRVLLLPGWQNSDAAHWQSRWEALHGFERLPQHDWQWSLRGDWMAQLDAAVQASARPTVLVAHSLGCQLVAAWAARSQHTARVRAALLVAAPDTEQADMPPQLSSWRPIARQPLPFAAQLLFSTDDPFCSPARAQEMAAAWQVPASAIGALGHINSSSGLGDWPDGLARLHRLVTQSASGVAAGPH